MTKFHMVITGYRDLLMHNGMLADPISDGAKLLKEFADKRKKTDAEYAELARREFMGGLYYDTVIGPYIPAQNVEKAIIQGARMSRQGKNVERGLLIESADDEGDQIPLQYDGPRDRDALWKSGKFAHRSTIVVNRNRVPRTRPIFAPGWRLECVGKFDDEQMNWDSLQLFVERAGSSVGLGDWRPRYGRFTAELTMTEGPDDE